MAAAAVVAETKPRRYNVIVVASAAVTLILPEKNTSFSLLPDREKFQSMPLICP